MSESVCVPCAGTGLASDWLYWGRAASVVGRHGRRCNRESVRFEIAGSACAQNETRLTPSELCYGDMGGALGGGVLEKVKRSIGTTLQPDSWRFFRYTSIALVCLFALLTESKIQSASFPF